MGEDEGRVSGQRCMCMCVRWGHEGVCTGFVETEVVLETFDGERVPVPVCEPCKRHIPDVEQLSNGDAYERPPNRAERRARKRH